jgi:hypothetical protein
MANIIDQLLNFLSANQTDPMTYLLFFFLFSVAAAVILPIPIEIGLIWNPGTFFPIKALDMGLGKAVGSIVVFLIPLIVVRILKWRPVRHFTNALREAGGKSGISRLRTYRATGDLMEAVKTALRKSGIDRSRIFGKMKENQSKAPGVAQMPRWGWLRWIGRKSEALVRKHGVIAVYVLLSIPGMVDTVILYIFAIINANRTVMTLRAFALANFLAGINRAFIIYAVLEILGVRLF